jgi:hypothetical protein
MIVFLYLSIFFYFLSYLPFQNLFDQSFLSVSASVFFISVVLSRSIFSRQAGGRYLAKQVSDHGWPCSLFSYSLFVFVTRDFYKWLANEPSPRSQDWLMHVMYVSCITRGKDEMVPPGSFWDAFVFRLRERTTREAIGTRGWRRGASADLGLQRRDMDRIGYDRTGTGLPKRLER